MSLKEKTVVERHPWEPFLPKGAKVLLLGTFPPSPEKWAMEFHYPNANNHMWQMFGLIYFDNPLQLFDQVDKKPVKEKAVAFLEETKIAHGSTTYEIIRTEGTAADSNLKVVTEYDVEALLQQLPHCNVVITTGGLAADIFAAQTHSNKLKIGEYVELECAGRTIRHYRLPSTSGVNTHYTLKEKAEAYKEVFLKEGIIEGEHKEGESEKIATNRISHRELQMKDAESMAHHANDVEVWQNLRDAFPHPYTLEDAKRFIDYCQRKKRVTDWAITVDDKAVGAIGIVPQIDINRISAEIGFWIGREYWGKGVVSYLLKEVTNYILKETKISHLYAGVIGDNSASKRVLEKAGYRYVGVMKRSTIKNGKIVDLHLFEKFKE